METKKKRKEKEKAAEERDEIEEEEESATTMPRAPPLLPRCAAVKQISPCFNSPQPRSPSQRRRSAVEPVLDPSCPELLCFRRHSSRPRRASTLPSALSNRCSKLLPKKKRN
jgi:hypothetical protein